METKFYGNFTKTLFLKLDVDVAKAAANGKPDFPYNFDAASRLNVLFPVIALLLLRVLA
jgi:hypothetical protein